MPSSAFDVRAHRPTEREVRSALGAAAPFWASLIEAVREQCTPVTEEWSFASAKVGWSMRLKHGDRIVLYLTPQEGRFVTGVVLGDKAVSAAKAAGRVSEAALAVVSAAPKYAEGRGIRLTVASAAELAIARELALIKVGR
jgi:uncharacterized protein DUF3788